MSSVTQKFEKMFGLDPRSLGLMRISYGLLILLDLAIRATSFEQHYTERGAFPLAVAFSQGLQPDQFSLHVLSGSADYQRLLFLLHAAAAILLVLGWRTRFVTILCFVFAVSLQNRNFLLLNGGDNWMRIVLFWAIFLPWGRRFSLDSAGYSAKSDSQVASVATVGLLLQVMSVYLVSALYKTGPAWRVEGSAAYLALNQLEWNSDLGTYLLYFPKLLTLSTFAVFYFEVIGPWLLISPFWSERLRALAVAGFLGFHLGLEITMELGVFPLVGVCTVVGLTPALFWRSRLGSRLEFRLGQAFATRRWNRILVENGKLTSEKIGPWTGAGLIGIIVLSLYVNAAGRYEEYLPVPQPVSSAARFLGLDQYWGLFAPEPGRRAGWFVIEGLLSDGTRVDLLTGGPVDWSAPRSASVYRTQRLKRWMVSVSGERMKEIVPYYARYLFRDWARRNPTVRLEKITGHYLSRPTLPDYEDGGIPTDYIFMDYTREQLETL